MTIAQIQYFFSIIEHGGFSVAADHVYVSQSTLSKQIQALEKELGIELFTRANNKISLTPSGEIFLKYAKQIHDSYSVLLQELDYFQNSPFMNTISLGTLPLTQEYRITDQLISFQESISNVQIDITEDNQEALLQLLNSKKLDLAILRHYKLDPKIYDFSSIQEDKFVLVCRKDQYDIPDNTPISLRMFADFPFVVLDPKCPLHHLAIEHFTQLGLNPAISYTATRHTYLLNLVNAGLGFTLLPSDLIDNKLFPDLICLPFQEATTSSVGIVRLRQHNISQHADLLYNFFKDNPLVLPQYN